MIFLPNILGNRKIEWQSSTKKSHDEKLFNLQLQRETFQANSKEINN
jgi:hypothetical protein